MSTSSDCDEAGDPIHEVLFGVGIDRIEYLTDGSGTHRFPLEDIRGSVLSVVDQSGAEMTSFSYSAYGPAISGSRYAGGLPQFEWVDLA